jgi:ATP-dependent RNA helicase HelY
MSLDTFFSALDFDPDPFQREAAAAVDEGASVVVTAPTGAGKTLIAEAAVHLALGAGNRAFYTAPIKALSNQKYADFVAVYGENRVGLLTGDNVVNGDADIVVMTTEVLRNMIYADSPALRGLGVVVLDEVHYLQDPFRGQVWEEVIIHLPAGIPLVCLSATIANPEEFTAWIRARRGETRLVVERHRPVPLESLYLFTDRFHGHALELHPVFARKGDGRRPNPRVESVLRKGRGRHRRFGTPRRTEVAGLLHMEGLLPAIHFVFSRAGCEQAAEQVAASPLRLTSDEERQIIREHAAVRTAHLAPEDLDVLGYERWLSLLERGVAPHHAGMVPAFKETVEDLFTAALLKLVFATETLSLGINMPARTVVLERLSKFTGESHELLQPGDYTQLTGRAGRRGIDLQGTAVVLHSPHVPFDKVCAIAAAGSHPLVSSFRPTYNMAVNLVANYPQERAEALLTASFAQFRAESQRDDLAGAIADEEADLARFSRAAGCDRGDVWAYVEAGGPAAVDAAADLARHTKVGDVLAVPGAGRRRVVLARGYGPSPRLLTLGEEGDLQRTAPADLDTRTTIAGSLVLPEPVRPRDPDYRERVLTLLEVWEPDGPTAPRPGPSGDLPGVAGCPDLADHLRWAKRALRSRRRLGRLQRRVGRIDRGLVDRFHAVLHLLDAWGYVDGWHLTGKGQRLRFVYGELDVLVAESAERGLFEGASPAEMAALASTFVYEARRDDPGVPVPGGLVEERIADLLDLAADLAAAERERGIPEGRPPETGFAGTAHAWVAGADLEDLFGDDDFAAGDFVRTCRQLLDLLRQVRDTYPSLAGTAGGAIRALDRGVVAAGGRL